MYVFKGKINYCSNIRLNLAWTVKTVKCKSEELTWNNTNLFVKAEGLDIDCSYNLTLRVNYVGSLSVSKYTYHIQTSNIPGGGYCAVEG